MQRTLELGILADTHNLLHPEVFEHFAGVAHILHAGDIGDPELLVELEAIAPVTAVWGNTDGWELRRMLPEIARIELAGVNVVVLHGQQWGSPTPAKAAASFPEAGLVVFGHSHRAVISEVGSVLAVNPGSAGPVRFGTAPTLARATLREGRVAARILRLDDEPASGRPR